MHSQANAIFQKRFLTQGVLYFTRCSAICFFNLMKFGRNAPYQLISVPAFVSIVFARPLEGSPCGQVYMF